MEKDNFYQKQFDQLEKEYNKFIESDDPRLKSLERQLASLRNAQKAAQTLKRNKKLELENQFKILMNDEIIRHEKKLEEISQFDPRKETEKLKKQIQDTKKDLETLKQMQSFITQHRYEVAEKMDNAKKLNNEAFLKVQEDFKQKIDLISTEKNKVEKEKQDFQVYFLKEKKILLKKLKELPEITQKNVRNLKNAGNSAISEKKIEHLDRMDKIQLVFLETRDKVIRQRSAFTESRQMKGSQFEVQVQELSKNYTQEIEVLKTQLDGYRGLYQEREDVLRQKKDFILNQNRNLNDIEDYARQLEITLNNLLSELSQQKEKFNQLNPNETIEKDPNSLSELPLLLSSRKKGAPIQKPFS